MRDCKNIAVAVAVAVKYGSIMDKIRKKYIVLPIIRSMVEDDVPANAIIRVMKRLGMSYRRQRMLRDISKIRKRYAG